jgi:hypothetical protein
MTLSIIKMIGYLSFGFGLSFMVLRAGVLEW